MTPVAWTLASLLAFVPIVSAAQAETTLRRGVKIRIFAASGPRLAYVDTLTAETLMVHERNRDGTIGSSASYRRDFLRTVYVARPRGASSTFKGALLGVVLGAGVGFVIGSSVYSPEDCDFLVCSAKASGTAWAILGGILGLPAGAIIGSLSPPHWDPVRIAP